MALRSAGRLALLQCQWGAKTVACCSVTRGLKLKSLMPDDPWHPDPWDYKNRGFTWYHAMYDGTTKRLNENSKIIVVEGNTGSGKSALAKDIADLLGMHYMPAFNMDEILIDRYGIDWRDYYQYFPTTMKIPGWKEYYANPYGPAVGRMQYYALRCRYEQWLNAVAHLLNTGQGVVIERSFFSDFVFVNAMYRKNIVSKHFFNLYHIMRKLLCSQLRVWPHLVIYLDCPVQQCLDNLKNKGKYGENKSEIMDAEYLSVIEDSYRDLIAEYEKNSYVLVYDWEKAGDPDMVCADLERLALEPEDHHEGKKLQGWWQLTHDETQYQHLRWASTNKGYFLRWFSCNRFVDTLHDCEELYIIPAEFNEWQRAVTEQIYQSPFRAGYQRKRGDSVWNMLVNHVDDGETCQFADAWVKYKYPEQVYSSFTYREVEQYHMDYFTGKDRHLPDYHPMAKALHHPH